MKIADSPAPGASRPPTEYRISADARADTTAIANVGPLSLEMVAEPIG